MKATDNLEKKAKDEIQPKSLLDSQDNSFMARLNGRLKNAIYIAGLAGIGLLFNSCIGGFIITEPIYLENIRPSRPSSLHIWIDGDWFWSNQTHAYVQRNGHWEQPKPDHTYVNGYWQTSSRGKTWKSGHWNNQGQKGNKHKR